MTYTFEPVNYPDDPLTGSLLLGINDAGEVVGYFDSVGSPLGFSAMPPFVLSGSFQSTIYPFDYGSYYYGAVNNFGIVAGTLVDAAGNRDGYVYDGNLPENSETLALVIDPGTPAAEIAAGTAFNEVLGINDLGVAVGYRYERSTNTDYGYIYNSQTAAYAAFTLAGASNVVPAGINDAGTICGSEVVGGVTIGFIDQGGVVTQLTGPAGATEVEANALNNDGQVAGQYTDASGTTHGFIYDVATASYTTIDDPNAQSFTAIYGINDQDQIVGEYDTGGYAYGFLGTAQDSFETVDDPFPGTTVAVGDGAAGLGIGGSNAVTLLDPGYGDVTMFGNSGNDTFVLQADSDASGDVWVGGAGNNRFFDTSVGYATETPTASIFLGDGTNTVVSDGEAEVVASGGDDTLYDPRFAFGGDAGSSMLVSSDTDATVVVGGAGALTTFFSAAGAVAFGGTGQGTFVGGGDTFVVGDGPSSVYAGANAASPDTAVFLEGAADVMVDDTATPGYELGFLGAGSSGADVFVLGQGDVYLTLGSGPDAVFLGSGLADVFAGAGPDTYTITAGEAGGETLLNGFRPGIDIVNLVGYAAGTPQTALADAVVQGGSTYVTLSDNTQLDFVGITNLPSNAFG